MKFIADVMLGRLAKRMRLLGYDVLYDRSFDDNEIIRLSLDQERIILTRDISLSKRPLASNHVLIKSEDVNAQIDQVLAAFPFEPLPPALSRCSVCNEPLAAISREVVRDRVPDHVIETQTTFLHCDSCGRVFWKGTHVRRMELKGR